MLIYILENLLGLEDIKKITLLEEVAAFTSMSKTFSLFFIPQFAFRKYSLYKGELSFCDAIKYMNQGRREYKCKKKIEHKLYEKKKLKIFLQGDFYSITGPSIANRDLKKSLEQYSKIFYSKYKNSFLKFIELLIKTFVSDSIILCGFSRWNFILLYVARKIHRPVFYYMHGCHRIEDEINNILNNEKIVKQEKNILEQVDKVICVSDFFKNKICEIYPEYREKIIVHCNCLDLSKFHFCDKKEMTYTVLSTGDICPEKRIPLFVGL